MKKCIWLILVLIISFFTYFKGYWYPAKLFWDENYHMASAQKYINGVFFMEPHPPLGKFFIAAGELLLRPNKSIDTSSFLTTDYIKEVPAGYSFAGVRFFPTLFAMLAAVMFYLVLYELSQKPFLSFLFTSLYLFENAIIVHSRGAMLEGTQIFFFLIFIYAFTRYLRQKKISHWDYLVFGLLYGAISAIKLNGVVMGFFGFVLVIWDIWGRKNGKGIKNPWVLGAQTLAKLFSFVVGFILVFCGSYYIHIVLGANIMSGRTYKASPKYLHIIDEKKTTDLKFFPLLFREHATFIADYQQGVPSYNVCKEDENGSLPFMWPFGRKSINYRWEQKGNVTKYLYLQGNPIIWFAGLAGVVFSFILIGGVTFFQLPVKNNRIYFFILCFFTVYSLYMGSMFVISRVMYLYHYFLPFILSLFLFFLIFLYITDKKEQLSKQITVFLFFIIAAFFFFSPLTYYQPLTTRQFNLRNWLPWWGMESVP